MNIVTDSERPGVRAVGLAGVARTSCRVGNAALIPDVEMFRGNHRLGIALTDGLILLRAMFGLTGTAVTTGAVGLNAIRNTWDQIQPYLNGNCATNFAP